MLSRRQTVATLAGTIVAASALPGAAQGQLLRGRLAARMRSDAVPGAREYPYGPDALNRLDLWLPKTKTAALPLVVFVHGGGWRMGDKSNATGAAAVEHQLGRGIAVASIDYRLVPAATVAQQAGDVAAALAWLRANAARLGLDPERTILMGHSAGAHLVALVGTDPSYFAAAGLRLDDVRGIVALDGACYDVARQIAEGGSFMHDAYVQAFGSDPARQKALSPITHAAAPNAPSFLILHVDRADGRAQAQALAEALRAAGTPVELHGFEGKGLRGHMAINRELGRPDYPTTPILDDWIARRLGNA